MRIGILTPMRQELGPVVQAFSLQRTTLGDMVVQSGTIGDTEVVATLTGIGMDAARLATAALLDAASLDHVMVVGIAGGVGPTVKVGDLVFPSIVIDKSSGTEFEPTHLGDPVVRGTLVSSDDFTVDPGAVHEMSAAGVVALDMETAGIAEVCVARGCEWSVIRGISDMATDHPDDAVLGLVESDGSANRAAVAKFREAEPNRVPHLERLKRDMKIATAAAAEAAARACGAS